MNLEVYAMNTVTNSLSLQFNEASDFYHQLAMYVSDLTVKHALLKVSSVFKELRYRADKAPDNAEARSWVNELSFEWLSKFEQLQAGSPDQPHLSLLDQRIQVEKQNMVMLRQSSVRAEQPEVKRWLADITANYIDALDTLLICSKNKEKHRNEQ